MIVDTATRIRLEGHLENIERLVAAWRGAAAALKQSEWEHDARSLSLLEVPDDAESISTVSAKLGNDGILRELAAVKERVRQLAASRLGRPASESALELLRELKRKRRLHVLHAQLVGQKIDLGGRIFLAVFGGFTAWLAVMVALITIDPNHVTPSLFARMTVALATVGVPLTWSVRSHLRSRRRLVVTEEKLIIEGGTPRELALSELGPLTATQGASEWLLTANGLEPVETTMDPEELLAWVEKQGVKVEVR